MGAADQIVDSSSSTINNSNNDGEFDDDFKRVSQYSRVQRHVCSNPTFFLDKKIFPLPPKRAPKRSASKKLLVLFFKKKFQKRTRMKVCKSNRMFNKVLYS